MAAHHTGRGNGLARGSFSFPFPKARPILRRQRPFRPLQGTCRMTAATTDPLPPDASGPATAWRYAPHAIIFFSSAFIMVVELVAGRLIARHLGSSIYTWTSVIGVILAGISIGNYLGGWLADQRRPASLL